MSARVELTLASVSGVWTQAGRPIAIHRLRQPSAEHKATWACAVDSNVSNFQPDCSGANVWNMAATVAAQQPWISPPSATATIRDGQTGVVSFDVTADVAAILNGSAIGHGWLIKKVDELLLGQLEFSSREGESAPRLVLEVDGAPTGGPGPVTGSATLLANRDTDVRHLLPNQNFGDRSILNIQALGKNRGMVGFDAQALGAALGGALVNARLRLPIAETSIGWGPDRALGAHRLRRSWSELGATWNCGIDSNPTNLIANCSGATAWTMLGAAEEVAWLTPPTDTVLVSNGQVGTLEFDVTPDVACSLAGHSSFDGWLIKKAMESQTGRIELSSRESQQPPALFIEWTNGQGVVVSPSDCDLDAPPGCTPTAPQDSTCNGVDEDCDGVVDDDFEVTQSTCGVGACGATGELTCVSGQVTNTCAPGTPAASDASCNGIDEDCSGAADEDYVPATTSCGVGECAAQGQTSCVIGQVLDGCAPGTPAANDSSCDGADDDCDGVADEDYASRLTSCGVGACAAAGATSCVAGNEVDSCTAGSPALADASCNGIDDDCNGTADEDHVAVNTSCGVGACGATGTTSCAQGQVNDSCQSGTPAVTDTSCNGIDDDCNGAADEDYAPHATSYGVGACAATGQSRCLGGNEDDGCDPGTPAPSDASCNGADDDCDGTSDEDYVAVNTSCGVGACGATGTTSCSSGQVSDSCQPGTPAASDASCNLTDDDCDGAVDEDFVGTPTSCGAGACVATGVTSCASGQVINGCAPGTPAASDATCDGQDDDCDGQNDEDNLPACDGASRVTCVGGQLQNTDCADGDACNGAEICAGAGLCQAGSPPVLDDGDPCTTDTCSPSSGVEHALIPGCDGAPVAAGGRFETRVSVLGKVRSQSGAAVTDFTVDVYDAPAGDDPRTDVVISSAGDGSFRARLSEFPESFPESTPSHHLVVKINTPTFISAMRDVYVRPGDPIDLGDIYLLERDPRITWIGPAGGVATDSQDRIEVIFPAGAVIAPTPVQITPIDERRLFPHPLPDATDTAYGIVLEPSQEFATPVTLRVDNTLNVPTALQIPVGVVDEVNGGWEHLGLALWDGSAFRFTLEHFSTVDLNPSLAGQLYIIETAGADTQKATSSNCAGSSVSYGSGALRQSFSLPSYMRQGREYSVTLNYDSSLTGGHRLGQGPVSSNATAVGGASGSASAAGGISLSIPGPTYRFDCVARGGSGGSGCATGSACFPGVAVDASFAQRTFMAGSELSSESQALGAKDGVSTSFYVTLPLNDDRTVPEPSYFPYQRETRFVAPIGVAAGGGTCSGGGAAFGVQASVQTPVRTNLQPGPMARVQGYELLYHRRSSPLGTGWGIDEVHEAFRSPNGAQVDLIHGDGHKESFYPRVEPDVVGTFSSSTGAVFAQDFETGEVFYHAGGIARMNADWTTTVVVPSTGLFNVRSMAIDYVDDERRFFIATIAGLYEVAAGGQSVQIAAWPQQNGVFNRPRVTAGGGAVYFTDGNASVIRRILLSDTLRTVQDITRASGGDVRVDPTVPAGEVSLDLPRGLAMGLDGALYVTCFRRHMVYRLLPGDDGLVGPESQVERVLGNGVASFSARGGLQVAKTFAMNQPLDLAFSEDGYLFVMNTEGIVRFDPVSQMAWWFANEREQGFNFQVDDDPSFLALDKDQVLVHDSRFITLTHTGLASEFEPRRRIQETADGLQVVDVLDDTVETYAWVGNEHLRARLVSRVARTGEALLAVGYVPDSDRVAWLEDPTGGRFSFAYDGGGVLTSIEDATGRITNVSVDTSNNLRELEMPSGESRQFDYAGHLMVAAVDPRGEETSYDYREDGTIERVTRPGGASREFSPAFGPPSYVGNQLVRQGSYTDEYGVTHSVRVDEAGQLIGDLYVADGISYDQRQVYQALLSGDFREERLNKILKVSHSTMNGVQLGATITWDAMGRPVRASNPAAGTGIANTTTTRYSIAYDANSRISIFDPAVAGHYHRVERDANGRVASVQDWVASGQTQRVRRTNMTWRSDGQVDVLMDHGIPTAHTYDASSGNLSGWSDMTGAAVLDRDAAGNITFLSDGVANVEQTYDDSNRLTSVTDGLGNSTLIGYDQEACGCAKDNLITSIQTPDLADHSAWRMQYDADGRLLAITDPAGFSERYQRTANGDIAVTIDRLLRSTQFTYDQLGRPATRRDAANRMGAYAYPIASGTAWSGPQLYAGSADDSVPPLSLTAALAPGQYQVGVNAIPSGDGPPQIELYRDATFQLSYANRVDNLLRLDKRADRSALSIASAEPFVNLNASGPYFDGIYTYHLYSSQPNLVQYTSMYPSESAGESGVFTYNDWFDLVDMEGFSRTTRYAAYVQEYAIARDAAGRKTALAQQYNARSATGSGTNYTPPGWAYGYDANGYTDLVNNGSGVQNVIYDARGLVSVRTLSYQITTSPVTTTTEGSFSYDYDQVGRNTYLQYPDGHVRRQQYDAVGRLTSRCYEYGGDDARCYTAEYDPVGNPVVLTDPEGSSLIFYDELDRVVEVRRQVDGEPDEIEGYEYNALGALSVHAGEAVDHQRQRIDSSGTAPAAVPNTHAGLPVSLDLGGRITALNGASMVFNKQTKLRNITEDGVIHHQGYDAFQRRIGYHKPGLPAEVYLYEDDQSIVAVLNGTGLGGIQKRILYDGVDHPLWMYDNARDITVYFELDTIGNVRRLRGGRAVAPNTTAPPADLGGLPLHRLRSSLSRRRRHSLSDPRRPTLRAVPSLAGPPVHGPGWRPL